MIYRPREDSFLLLETIKDLDLEGKKCLDIGTGSGILAEKMNEKGGEVLATDINEEASKQLNEEIEFKKSDLFENVDQEFDYIVFNPPYLPGSEKDVKGSETWNGGIRGTETTEKMLKDASNYLTEDGEAYIIGSTAADIEELIQRFNLEIADSEKLWFEKLLVLKYRKE